MKYKGLIITTTIFFLVINTSYFWEGKFGFFAFPIFILLIIVYIVFVCLLIQQLFTTIIERFRDKQRLVIIGLLTIVLALKFIKPNGVLNFDKFAGKDLIVAVREGGGNCMITLKLKDSNKFIDRSVCFGVSETKGKYTVKSDTVFFKDVQLDRNENEYYKYGVIKIADHPNKKILGDFVLFRGHEDTIPLTLWITTNELRK